ncbi:MAG: c-type cytochrome [Deltaproteobacteria bacterium]|nr:MAG: c-type cytochrome [Deltaproteobacteria bacterium]
MRFASPFLMTLALAGCTTGEFADPLHPSGSRTLVVSADREEVHVVNVEEGTISTVALGNNAVSKVDVGGEPTRIARHGDRVFATLRQEGSLAVLRDTGNGLELESTVPLGAEPYGVVTHEDGRVFVALSMENEVVGLDAETLEIFGRWEVPNEPRWLAISAGDTVFVGCQKAGGIYQIDVSRDEVISLEPPLTKARNATREVNLTTRVTGDPAVSPDGRFLLVPVLEVDNETSAIESAAAGNNAYYAPVTAGVGRFNPGAAVFGLDGNGRVQRSLSVLHAVSAIQGPSEFDPIVVRSFISSITVSPDGKDFLMPMEGSRTVVSLTRGETDMGNTLSTTAFIDHDEFRLRGFTSPPRATATTGNGPRSVVYVDADTKVVHNWLDRSVVPFQGEFSYGNTGEDGGHIGSGVRVEESRLSPEVEAGRLAFHTARDSEMQASGSGVSCATCHFDSREDGLSWPLEGGARQTPTLVGTVSDTAPITWAGGVASVADEVQLTTVGRMGGGGASQLTADNVAAYVDWTRQPEPSWKLDRDAVVRGEEIFNRPEVGCAECHPAPAYTDGQSHAVLGGTSVDTPTLRGIASSGPYFHDGSRGTLEEVMSTAVTGSMGDASMLSEEQLADLTSFVKSL